MRERAKRKTSSGKTEGQSLLFNMSGSGRMQVQVLGTDWTGRDGRSLVECDPQLATSESSETRQVAADLIMGLIVL